MTSSKQQVKRHFSERATQWAACYADGDLRSLSAQNLTSRQRLTLEMVKESVPPPAKVLDLGCGTGEMAAKLIEGGYEVWGVDISEAMILHARNRCQSDRFRVGDMEHVPFPDESFDAVVCLGVIEYLASDEQALREIWRVLRPGGRAVVATPSAISPIQHLDRALFGLMTVIRPLYHLVRYKLRGLSVPFSEGARLLGHRRYYRRKWLRLLSSLSLEPEEWICHGLGWYLSPLGELIENLFRKAKDFGRRLDGLPGSIYLSRAGDKFARNRALNWLAAEQIVRVRAIK